MNTSTYNRNIAGGYYSLSPRWISVVSLSWLIIVACWDWLSWCLWPWLAFLTPHTYSWYLGSRSNHLLLIKWLLLPLWVDRAGSSFSLSTAIRERTRSICCENWSNCWSLASKMIVMLHVNKKNKFYWVVHRNIGHSSCFFNISY